jgi:acyl dehydratase
MPLDLSLVGKPSSESRFTYGWKDLVTYALGIGAKREELDYLYEGRGPKVYPSFAVVPTFGPMFELLGQLGGNLAMVVHSAQKVTVHAALGPKGTLRTTSTIRGIYDMRRFASVVVDTETRNDAGEKLFSCAWSLLFRGEGGFGGAPPPKEDSGISLPKETEPTFRIEEGTTHEQALLYRLSGDPNPLHADPEFAKMAGFEQGPILHGLCTYGHMVRHVARAACGGDASRITAFDATFRRPVWPGDTLVTEGYEVAPGKFALSVKVKERNEAVVTGAWATLSG